MLEDARLGDEPEGEDRDGNDEDREDERLECGEGRLHRCESMSGGAGEREEDERRRTGSRGASIARARVACRSCDSGHSLRGSCAPPCPYRRALWLCRREGREAGAGHGGDSSLGVRSTRSDLAPAMR